MRIRIGDFQSILIAGTNGKGSTAATLSSILTASGLRTGLYTSPHLERVNERVRVNGAEITDGDFARHFFAVMEAAENLVSAGTLAQMPSFFEVLTAIGFLHFAEQGVDVAVLEVGMGGRLDATNIVDPLISIVTDISLDHMEWLGSTIGGHYAGEGGDPAPARSAGDAAAASGGEPGAGRGGHGTGSARGERHSLYAGDRDRAGCGLRD